MGITERKEREKQMRRDAIMDAAEQLFFMNGVERTTMDDIAKESELSKGTLYLYFKSKEEIHWAITQRGIKALTKKIEKELDPNANAIESLIKIGNMFIEFTDDEKTVASSMIFFQGADLSKLNLPKDQIENVFTKESPIFLVLKYVEQGIKEGSIRDDISVNALASALWSQLLGVIQVMMRKKEIFKVFNITKEEVFQSHFEIVLNGIKK
jgi:AcrR family transcriptional regulator